MICHADKLEVFKNNHLAIHLVDDRSWKVPYNKDYAILNEQELYLFFLKFKAAGQLNFRPLVERFMRKIERNDQRLLEKISRAIYDFVLFLKAKLK